VGVVARKCGLYPESGIGQAVIFFEKTLKKVAISPNPLWPAFRL
jgi:hypothetical protein